MLHQIRLQNLLSFGPDMPVLHLRPLNVIIGPNGSGKSNLIEMIGILRACSRHLGEWGRDCGGISSILKQGSSASSGRIATVTIEEDVRFFGSHFTRHTLEVNGWDNRLTVRKECVESGATLDKLRQSVLRADTDATFFLDNGDRLEDPSLKADQSVLSQRIDPDRYPTLTSLSEYYSEIRTYRDWSFGRMTPPRLPQRTDGRSDYLESDCSNLGMVLNRIRRDPAQKEQLIERLNDLYPGIKDVDVSIEGGTVQVFLTEGKYAMPATRLSDGTLRYLCLLAILLHPTPPPLICIEEPELGLHPDVMPAIGKLLKQASERTQLIVTTHSDELVDSLSESPEDVVVCEKHDGCTTFNRLDGDQLKVWLEDYQLGTLWRRGDIGGNRW